MLAGWSGRKELVPALRKRMELAPSPQEKEWLRKAMDKLGGVAPSGHEQSPTAEPQKG